MPFLKMSKHLIYVLLAFFPLIMGKQQNYISSLVVVDQIFTLAQRHGFPRPLGKLTNQNRERALTLTGVILVLTKNNSQFTTQLIC